MGEMIESTGRVLAERTPDIIASEIKFIEAHVSKTVLMGAVEIGSRLHEIKETLPHGEWESWCSENLNYSKSKAERFMKISTEYGDENSPYFKAISKTSTLTDLSISNALSLLKVPEEEVENFVENHDLSTSTVKELEDEIKKLKQGKEKADSDIENLMNQLREADVDNSDVKDQLELAEQENDRLHERIEELQKELSQPAEVNTEELDKLRAELSDTIAKLKKSEEDGRKNSDIAKNKLEEAENRFKEEIAEIEKKAKSEAMEEAQKAASEASGKEIESLTREKEEALERARNAEAKLNASDSEALATFKVFVDQIQKDCQGALSALELIEKEKRDKLRPALNQILQSFIGE